MGTNQLNPNSANFIPNNATKAAISRINEIKFERWRGGQHPTFQGICQKMEAEGLRPYSWNNGPNARIAARSHTYAKVMYCVSGSLELLFPDTGQSLTMRAGDRVELPGGVRHATLIGIQGAQCVEAPRR